MAFAVRARQPRPAALEPQWRIFSSNHAIYFAESAAGFFCAILGKVFAERTPKYSDREASRSEAAKKTAHLDARLAGWLPEPRRISSGKGSPSAHTAPSSKYSFFQMGTVRLSASISQWQASNAAARWADATTISTLVSPISRRPRRCTRATSRI